MKTLNPLTVASIGIILVMAIFVGYWIYKEIRKWWAGVKADRIIDYCRFCENVRHIEQTMDEDYYNESKRYVSDCIWKLGISDGEDCGKREQIDVLSRKYQDKYHV